jgi:hypothetical protein
MDNPIANAGVNNQERFLKTTHNDLLNYARKNKGSKSKIEQSLNRLESHKKHEVKNHASKLKQQLEKNTSWKTIKD